MSSIEAILCWTCGRAIERGQYLQWRHVDWPGGRGHYARPQPARLASQPRSGQKVTTHAGR